MLDFAVYPKTLLHKRETVIDTLPIDFPYIP